MKTSSSDGFQFVLRYVPGKNCQLVYVLTNQTESNNFVFFNDPAYHINCTPEELMWAGDHGVWIDPGDYLVVSSAGVLHMTAEEFKDVLTHAPELKEYIV